MSDKKENIEKQISELLKALSELKLENSSNATSAPYLILDDDIEVEVGPGTPIKIDSRTYYKMIYADVNNLKRDTESLLNLYLEDVKPTLKSVDDNVKELKQNFKTVESEIDTLKRNTPKTFKSWLEDKSKTSDNIVSVMKFIFWVVAFFWAISTALPTITAVVEKFLSA